MRGSFQPVCNVSDIGDGQSKSFSVPDGKGNDIPVAIFNLGGKFYALANSCAHKGGPLSRGQLKGEIVTCPWHGWKYSVVTGRSPHEGGDSVDSYETRVLRNRVYINPVPVRLGERKFKPHDEYVDLASSAEKHLAEIDRGARPSAALNVLGISTASVTERVERKSTSEEALRLALAYAREKLGLQTVMIKLRELNFKHCQGYYSTDSRACIFPCSISEIDKEDQMIEIYRQVVLWADVVLISTPIRWGSASSLYYKMVQRMNSVQNQATARDTYLVRDKAAAFIITGGQDNVQHVAGEMMSFWSQAGFVFGKFPFVGWTRGWYAEDTENNYSGLSRELSDGAMKKDLMRMIRGAVEMARLVKNSRYDERVLF
jgi:nitrite reductase/ring-hydroxylating ferredoxin subunit/multimeric flavodoxin WrbA